MAWLMISVYITCKSMAEAKRIAAKLLESKLIACANMFPVESMFNWKGKVKDIKEVAMLCKAKKGNFRKINEMVTKLHSYEVPCVAALSITDSNKGYESWVRNG